MEIPYWLEYFLISCCDLIYSKIPQKKPDSKSLSKCKIISHRGEHDNVNVLENTLLAFDNAMQNEYIWGIELDFRWTSDFYPVVFHDPDLDRLFGSKIKIAEMSLSKLKKRFPQIPTLEEVIKRYGGKIHLMIEAKEEFYPRPQKQNKILKLLFANLSPCEDFHILSLDPQMLNLLNFVESSAKIPVAIFNTKSLSKISLEKKYAGLCGHYLLINNRKIEKHIACGQKIGVGYPNSRNNLFREINRGVEWIFCNNASKMSRTLKAELEKIIDLKY